MDLPLILASASPRREALLRLLVPDFVVLPASVEESESEHLTPYELCQLNAYRKARAVAKRHPDALVLGADTVVAAGLQMFGKPATLRKASEMLAQLAGRTHEVITGVCLMHLRTHREQVFAERTWVTFHPLTRTQIDAYLKGIDPLDKAGAYAIQEGGEMIVEAVEGSLTNVVGLPVERIRRAMAKW